MSTKVEPPEYLRTVEISENGAVLAIVHWSHVADKWQLREIRAVRHAYRWRQGVHGEGMIELRGTLADVVRESKDANLAVYASLFQTQHPSEADLEKCSLVGFKIIKRSLIAA